MRIAVVFALGLAVFSAGAVAEEPRNWAFTVDQAGSPAVTAAYQTQCTEWAAEAGLADAAAREAFVGSCVKDMPSLWPVGYDEEG